MKRAQITIEYLVVLVVMILLFTSVSMDLTDFSLQNAMQSQTASLIAVSEHALLSSVEAVKYQGPGAVRSVSVRAPSDCSFIVGEKEVAVDCPATSFSKNYTGVKFAAISASVPVAYECPSCPGGEIKKGETQLVRVKKS
ncbi:MAG: hypothetical protein QXO69_00630 [archaeon]